MKRESNKNREMCMPGISILIIQAHQHQTWHVKTGRRIPDLGVGEVQELLFGEIVSVCNSSIVKKYIVQNNPPLSQGRKSPFTLRSLTWTAGYPVLSYPARMPRSSFREVVREQVYDRRDKRGVVGDRATSRDPEHDPSLTFRSQCDTTGKQRSPREVR
ncbi:hypothetical protein LIPSTDRAFT_115557 [Lipomyces starkeyi NRRL Y-11557]|uniref:Uncharacterized protein n=1 Tax=Lipomyces starkeyi NRRL Y-11557 TaxID=675824 RepID=A0A1E3QDF5_LIPST|nr:hypothetical protein LIPSTDRAFT_115557 [Lipomyces starkeyi NRRL Y-11557]